MSQTEQGLRGCGVVGAEDFVARGLLAQAAAIEAGAIPEGALPDEEVHTRPNALNPTRFLNRQAVREYILEVSKTRAHKFTRVSEETLVQINEAVRTACIGVVRRAPSKGKTL